MLEDTALVFDSQLYSLLNIMAQEGVTHAVKGFAGMVGQTITVSPPQVRLVPLSDIPSLLGGPENEAVGIYLRAQGEIGGQIMLIVSYQKALDLVDLMLGQTAGTTKALGRVERSALGELGNLTCSFFLSAVEASTGIVSRPSPPAVMVDMVGAIIDIVVTSYGGIGKHVLMLQVDFMSDEREAQANFWVIPDPTALEAFLKTSKPL